MGRRIFIIAGLAIAVLILGIMIVVEPSDRRMDYAQGMDTDALRTADISADLSEQTLQSATLPPIADTPLAAMTAATPVPPTPVPTPMSTPAPLLISPTPKPTGTPAATPAATAAATPTAKPAATANISGKPLNGIIIGVDPGHQRKDNKEMEPVAPGSSEQKKKVSSGTYGRFTGTPEHEVNLNVGLHLRDLLSAAGATVVMTRETADVDISNVERAQLFNQKNVALGVRIHCNGSNDASVDGAFMLIPKSNPYQSDCKLAAQLILEAYGRVTGIGIKKGITVRSDQTGFNWCERPIVNIEMGHMTNEAEDKKLSDTAFQKKMAQGIFEGIVLYFDKKA